MTPRRIYPIFVLFLFTWLLPFQLIAQDFSEQTTDSQSNILDLFDLPSIQCTIVVNGGGYFPILGVIDDRMFSVFRTGGGHINIHGALSLAWADPTGEIWSSPQTIVDSQADDRNPAVGILPSRRIVVGYHEQASYTSDEKYDPQLNRALCKVTWSDDQGKTWVPSIPLGIEGLESCSPYGRMIMTSTGTLLMTVYGPYSNQIPALKNTQPTNGDYAYLVSSQDQGETWGNASLIMDQHNETALLPLADGRLLAVGRSSGSMQRMDYGFSSDGGTTWSSPLRLTGKNQHPGDLLHLSNGWILLIYGDRGQSEEVIRGIISRDQGLTWDFSNEIICSRPVQGDFGYPSGLVLPNGNIAIIYYWAGKARDSYDGSQAIAFLVQCKESEFIVAYQQRLDSR